ncbi:MAG: hypothetical protein AB1791_20620 [Chloroflexota bacterium]
MMNDESGGVGRRGEIINKRPQVAPLVNGQQIALVVGAAGRVGLVLLLHFLRAIMEQVGSVFEAIVSTSHCLGAVRLRV